MSVLPSVWVEWTAAPISGANAAELASYHELGIHDADVRPLVGAYTNQLPVEILPGATLASVQAASPLDDIYDTIWVVPSELRVGAVTAQVNREIEVWNAYRETRTLDDIAVTSGEGIQVFGPTLPHEFGLLESRFFTVEVLPEGPATIDAHYLLVFLTDEGEPDFRVIGQRIIQWTIPPNWRQSYDETLSYRTEVLTADDGSEQRIGLRQMPRRSLAFTPLVNSQVKRDYQRLLATWQARAYAMADWARGVGMQGLPPGGQIVQLMEPMPELEEGRLIVLRAPGEAGTSQAIEVETISGNGLSVTLNSPVAEAFPVGSRAYPGLLVHAEPSLSSRRLTSDVATVQVAFRELWRAGYPELGTPDLEWRGLEVLLRRPNWADSPDHDHVYPFEWLDAGKGAFDYRTPVDAPQDVRRLHYTLEGRDEIRWWVRWFARVRGRRGEFYAPTWDRDLEASANLLEGSFQLPITDAQEIGRPANDRVYRNICVRLTDGTTILRQVITGEMGQSGPALVLGEGWPRNIAREEILAIHYMPRWRSASDDMTLSWVTNGVARLTVAWQTLRDVA